MSSDDSHSVIKPLNSDADFRFLYLPNKLKTLLVSKPSTQISGCCVYVASGSYHDPTDRFGLSHFLEHMLFLGNKRCPEEGMFEKYVELHAGNTNAATGTDYTYYYYTIDPTFLNESLDYFSEFFIEPLFNESSSEREVNAVNSEYEIDKNNSAWKLNQLFLSRTKSDSFLNRFSTGTKDTLPPEGSSLPETRQRLINLFKRYYSAQIMNVVIIGKGLFYS